MWPSAVVRGLFLAPACALCGATAQRMQLPQITGFLVAGVLVGPYALAMLNQSAVEQLWYVDQICLSAIATAAGAELHMDQLDKSMKQVVSITASIAIFTWALFFGAMLALAPLVSVTNGMSTPQIAVFASLAATLAMARSPASAIAVVAETKGRGPFCALVMAVVIVKDVVTIVAFSLNIEVARATFSQQALNSQQYGGAAVAESSSSLTGSQLLEPFGSVVVSTTLGIVGSAALVAVVRICMRVLPRAPPQHSGSGSLSGPPPGSEAAQDARGPHSHAHVAPGAPLTRATLTVSSCTKVACLLAVSTMVFKAAAYFDAEPLLACAVTGLVSNNTMREVDRDAMLHSLELAMPGINMTFFSLAGAALHLPALLDTLWLASLMFAVRVAAVWCGSYAGCWASGVPEEYRKRMWQTMLTQAGVALGLARMVAVRFPGWGSHFQTLMVSVIILNLLVGPPLFRSAIISAGESKVYSVALSSHHSDGELRRSATEYAEHP